MPEELEAGYLRLNDTIEGTQMSDQTSDKDPTPEGPGPLSLGAMIRRQRQFADLTMRQLSSMAGISNPYLSQIERGLREPSERVLTALAESLRISAEALSEQAARGETAEVPSTLTAIRADPDLTKQQKQSLEETYQAFREITVARRKRGRPAQDDAERRG